ncbi:MAG: hypothetical protein ACUVX1_15265 [Chloroflexota bacterium]
MVRLSPGPLTVDDAFITFRYARNLAEGLGFVYNAGERVLGTTTPLHALLLAGSYGLGWQDLPRVALTLSAFADSAIVVLVFWLGIRLGLSRGWAALASALFALSPLSITFAVSRMESSVFTLLAVGAIAADLAGRTGLAGFAAGLATLTRPEGLLVGVLILGRHLLARQSPPRGLVLAFLASVVPWGVIATWWFGSPVPQTILAKSAAYDVQLVENLSRLLLWLGPAGAASFIGVMYARTAIRRLRQEPWLWPVAGFAPVLLAGYFVGIVAGARLFPWYVVPIAPFCALGAAAGLRGVTENSSRAVACCTGAILIVATLLGLNLNRDPSRGALTPTLVNVVREEGYAAAARFLAPRLGPGAVVALPEIGTFGYLTRAYVLDTVGLVSPKAVRFYPLPAGLSADNAIPSDLIEEEDPDFLVGLDQFFQESLTESEWFRREYRLLATFEARIWGSQAVVVYERVEEDDSAGSTRYWRPSPEDRHQAGGGSGAGALADAGFADVGEAGITVGDQDPGGIAIGALSAACGGGILPARCLWNLRSGESILAGRAS